jgi:hypothetical protein
VSLVRVVQMSSIHSFSEPFISEFPRYFVAYQSE